jgi:hypothetical protein
LSEGSSFAAVDNPAKFAKVVLTVADLAEPPLRLLLP